MNRILLTAAAALLVAVLAVEDAHAAGWGSSSCSSGSCGTASAGCSSCEGKGSWFSLGRGNSSCSGGCNSGGCGSSSWAFWRKPCPSDAPTRRTDAPLAFPTHPYARSPRDYFMQD